MSCPGRISSRYVGVIDLSFSIGLIIWYTHKILAPSPTWKIHAGYTFAFSALYFILAMVMPILLIYSTFCYASESARRSLATLWCVFRGISVTILTFYIVFNYTRDMERLTATMVIVLEAFWGVALYAVGTYVGGLNEDMQSQPLTRKRKVSSVSVLTEEESGIGNEAVLTEDHLRQLNNFQTYVHRTSWCSDRSEQSNENTLQVPETKF